MKLWWLLAPLGFLWLLGFLFIRDSSIAAFMLVVPILVLPVSGWIVSAPDQLGWPHAPICGKCRYDLQGLSARAACPECGSLERGELRPSVLRSFSRGASAFVLGNAPAIGLWATRPQLDEPAFVVAVLMGFAVVAVVFGGAFTLIDRHLLAVTASGLRWFTFCAPMIIETLWLVLIDVVEGEGPNPSSLVFAMMVIPATVLTGAFVLIAAIYALTGVWKSKC